jgi:glycosyltransferase involved in cell wall biosynthesis
LHIALIHYSAPPVVGGVESVLAQHARLMAQAGHTVRILAARGEPLSDQIKFIPLPLIDSRHPRVLAAKAELDRGVVPADFEPLTSEILHSLQAALAEVDVLIAHNVCSLNKNLMLTAAIQRLDRPRKILWHHDLAWTTPRYQAELYDGYPWDLLRTDWGARHVVVSDLRQRELADLLRIPLESIAVVPNGIDQAAFFKFSPITLSLLQQIDLTRAAPILLLPVRLTPRKNIELALHTLAVLRRAMPEAILIVTGPLGAHNPANEAYFTRLKDLRAELNLSGAAIFLAELSEAHPERSGGRPSTPLRSAQDAPAAQSKDALPLIPAYLPDEVIADFYRLSDALLMPSREEGFGIPIIEAAFSKLPIFCSDIAPLHALGKDDATYFSPDEHPDRVAQLIVDRLRRDAVYQFAARARRSFSWDGIYRDHIAPLLLEA